MICQWCGDLKPIENHELQLCGSCNTARRRTGSAQLPDVPPAFKSKRQLAREYQKSRRRKYKY